MPTTNSRNLTLTREGANVRIRVTYNAQFTGIERNLAGLGMQFIERIAVIGVDPPGAFTGAVLGQFPGQFIPVPAGAGTVSVPRSREVVFTRAALDEDPIPVLAPDVDADEIRCRIRIESVGLPPAVTPDAFTDQEVLGGIFQPAAATAAAAEA